MTLTVRVASPSRFPLYVRAPSWSPSIEVQAGGRAWTGVRDGYVEVDRTWRDGDTVNVRLDLTPTVVSGGPTYPDRVAVVRGPQLLVADETLNPGAQPYMSDVWQAGLRSTSVSLHDRSSALPKRWHGTQAYGVDGYVGNSALGRSPVELVLVPIADAGQTGGEYRT